MNPRRKNRLYLTLGVIVGVALTSALVLYALRSNINLFYTPSEILQGKGKNHNKPQPGQRLRMGGMVMPGSVKRDSQSLKMTFKVYDAGGAISVSYVGLLPDLFREGQGVVVQGVLDEAGVLKAKEILAKHDEKYMPPEVMEAMKDNHRVLDPAYDAGEIKGVKS